MKELEVIPAILAKSSEEMRLKIDRVTPHVDTIHIDMMDGKFVPNTTLSTEETAKMLVPGKYYIFHWMVEKPEEEISKLGDKAKEMLHLVHAEVIGRERWDALKAMNIPLGIAINPPILKTKMMIFHSTHLPLKCSIPSNKIFAWREASIWVMPWRHPMKATGA